MTSGPPALSGLYIYNNTDEPAASAMCAEILNATNTPMFGAAANAIDLASFGRVTDQLGFSRIFQVSARYRF